MTEIKGQCLKEPIDPIPSIVAALGEKVHMTPIAWNVHNDFVVIVFEQGPKLTFDLAQMQDADTEDPTEIIAAAIKADTEDPTEIIAAAIKLDIETRDSEEHNTPIVLNPKVIEPNLPASSNTPKPKRQTSRSKRK